MKKFTAIILAFALVLSLCGCAATDNTTSYTSNAIATAFASDTAFSDRDFEVEYQESDCVLITLADGASVVSGSGASVLGDVINITEGGYYLVSGSLSDGQIYVEVADTEKVQIILDGVSISNSSTAGIYIYSGDKVFLTLASGSNNYFDVAISDSATVSDDETNVDAAIFSKSDLTINGSGSLYITSQSGNGITSKDDLTITSGNFYIVCDKNGLEANDTLAVADGFFNITTNGGSSTSVSSDAYDSAMTVDPGFSMGGMTGGMSGMTGGMSGGMSMGGGMMGMSDTESDDSIILLAGGGMSGMTGGNSMSGSTSTIPTMPDSPDMDSVSDWFSGINNTTWDMDSSGGDSAKAIKSDDVIYIEGGTFIIDSYDDAIHSDNNVFITGGDFSIATSDDAIHAEIETVISGGSIYISTCYEGLEGKRVTIEGGDIYINSLDDGVNASESDKVVDLGDISITIAGGSLVIDSTNAGDGVDSNGSIYMYGGYVLISSTTTTTDTSLDYEDEAIIYGGTFLATGSSGMTTQNFTEASQGSIFVTLSSVQTGTVTLTDSSGNIIASWNPTKEYQTVHISSSLIEDGKTYTLTTGSYAQTISMTENLYGEGSHTSMSGGMSMSGNRK